MMVIKLAQMTKTNLIYDSKLSPCNRNIHKGPNYTGLPSHRNRSDLLNETEQDATLMIAGIIRAAKHKQAAV
jgi:hypothetical protein